MNFYMEDENKKLIEAAMKATLNSYAPYSNFRVGAALLTAKNKIYLGGNIENSSYPATVCAERVAIFKAISEGECKFKKIAIVGGNNGKFTELCFPCGICRQVLSEFCNGKFEVILGKKNLEYNMYTLADLLPHAFELKK